MGLGHRVEDIGEDNWRPALISGGFRRPGHPVQRRRRRAPLIRTLANEDGYGPASQPASKQTSQAARGIRLHQLSMSLTEKSLAHLAQHSSE